jgi:hypothetical protein
VGFADYLRHLAQVACDMRILPGRDIRSRMISTHLGRESREGLSQAWGGCSRGSPTRRESFSAAWSALEAGTSSRW